MARRKNTKRIDPRYFLEETVNCDEKKLISTPTAPLVEEKKELVNLSNISEQRFQQILVEETIKALLEQDRDAGRWLGREIMAPGPGDPGYEPPDPRYTWKPGPEPPPAPEPVPPPRVPWWKREFPKPRAPHRIPPDVWKDMSRWEKVAHQLGRAGRHILRHPKFPAALAGAVGYEVGKRGQKYATHLIPGSPEYIKTGEQRIQQPTTPVLNPVTGEPFPRGEEPAGGLWLDPESVYGDGEPKIYELPGRDPRYVPFDYDPGISDEARDEYFKKLGASERFDWVPPSGDPEYYNEIPSEDWWDQIPVLGSAKAEPNVRKGVNWGVTDVDWSPRELGRPLFGGHAWDYDTGGSIIDWSPGKVAGSTFDAEKIPKRMVKGRHRPASLDPKYLAQRQRERDAAVIQAQEVPPAVEKAEEPPELHPDFVERARKGARYKQKK